MQQKKRKVISVSPESRKKLMALYGCSQTAVYQALAYVTHTQRAEQIRQDAINLFGGVPNTKVVFI